MLKDLVIDVQPRESVGKNAARRMRRSGNLPGVVYGGDRGPVPISVESRAIMDVLRSEGGTNTIFTLRLGGEDEKKRAVMLRDIQRDPVAGSLIHADFVRIDLTQEITVDVHVNLQGTAYGVKNEGGVLDFVTRFIEVTCLPKNIPDALEGDISELKVGDHLSASDLPLPPGVTLETAPEKTICVISLPRVEAVEEEAAVEEVAAEEGAEPEVMKKGKDAGEEDSADEKGKKEEQGKDK